MLAQMLGRLRGAALWAWLLLTTLWWVRVLQPGAQAGVYFTYQSVLVYACDAVLLLLLGLWIGERIRQSGAWRSGPRVMLWAAGAWFAFAGLSLTASPEPSISAMALARLALSGCLYLCCLNHAPPTACVSRGLAVVLAFQAAVAMIEFARQSTDFLSPLRLPWPGLISGDALPPGVSVVQLRDGRRWLRAYGTLPHPNILGGYLLALLAGPAERYLSTARLRWLALFAGGVAALALTFSRAAWLGLFVAGMCLPWLLSRRALPRFRRLAAAGAGAALVLAGALAPLFLARASGPATSGPEQFSVSDRVVLAQAALETIRRQPLTGVGIGTFVITLAGRPGPRLTPEPVHNLPLLVAAETGVGGGVALAALGLSWARAAWRGRRRSAAGAVWAAALAGMFVVGLFDHFWWTQAPALQLLVFMIGLWASKQADGGPNGRNNPASP